jgi:perosamine synthetase
MAPPEEIPVSIPDLSGNEEAYMVEAVRSSWISSTGPFVERFEREFAAVCGTRAAITVSNGTVALHLALLALGLRAGDEVIVPSLTYIATANAVRYAGATPVFADVDPATWCLDPRRVEALITPRTRGLIAVHLYGHPADMDALGDIARRRGLWIVEDAAEAHMATYKGRTVGALSSVAMFSFYGNKILTSGEGGALTLDDPDLEQRARLLRGQGMDPQRRYFFPIVGYNYRLTNVACAMLCAQLERRREIVARRRAIFQLYRQQLAGVPGIGLQPVAPWADPAPWLFCITVDAPYPRTRDELALALKAAGVDTRPFFVPIHQLPPYSGSPAGDLATTERLGRTGLNLPTYPALTATAIDRVCAVIRRA